MHGQHHPIVVPLVVQQYWCTTDSLSAPNLGNLISNAGGIELPTKLPDMN
jgi:hypothetical protein